MKSYSLIVIILFVLEGCEKVFNPVVDETVPSMVVEGMFTTKPEKNIVAITLSSSFNHPMKKAVSGLQVYVIDNNGKRIDFKENIGSGSYETGTDTSLAGKIGYSYTLYIENKEGDIYKSSPQLLNECPKIDKIYLGTDQEMILTEDSYGDVMEVNYNGVNIYSDTKAILPKNNYFLFRWFGYSEHVSVFFAPRTDPWDQYSHDPISQFYTSVINTANADDFKDIYLTKNKFVFIPDFVFTSYRPNVPSGVTLIRVGFQGIILVSEIYSLSFDAYNFWKTTENQLGASGKIFDPVSSQIRGNITCVTNPEKVVYGVFTVSDVKKRFDYLYYNSRKLTYDKELDSLPELWVDTFTVNAPPKGWIFPPF